MNYTVCPLCGSDLTITNNSLDSSKHFECSKSIYSFILDQTSPHFKANSWTTSPFVEFYISCFYVVHYNAGTLSKDITTQIWLNDSKSANNRYRLALSLTDFDIDILLHVKSEEKILNKLKTMLVFS